MKPHMCAAVAGLALLAGAFSPASAGAQAGTLTAAVSGIVAVPVGPHVDNRDAGPGAAVGLRYVPGLLPNVAIRLELSGLLSSNHEDGIVSNGSSELFATAGPEFDLPAGNGHIYTTATAGAARIWSSSAASSFATPDGGSAFSTMTTRDGTNFAWSGGGGFVTRRSSVGLAGDFGLRYYDLGRATYVTSYPGGTFGLANTPIPAHSTAAHHRVTFLAPSIGLSWRP